jgi:hypothetical protein
MINSNNENEKVRKFLKFSFIILGITSVITALLIDKFFAALFMGSVSVTLTLFTHLYENNDPWKIWAMIPILLLSTQGFSQEQKPILSQAELELTVNHLANERHVHVSRTLILTALSVDANVNLPQLGAIKNYNAFTFPYQTLKQPECNYWWQVSNFQYNPYNGEIIGFTLTLEVFEE